MIDHSQADGQVLCVSNFHDLVTTPFHGKINAICWTRELPGDFLEIVNKLTLHENLTTIEHNDLLELKLSVEGELARDIIVNDLHLLESHGASPTLNLIKNYERDNASEFFKTDVYSFHVDRSPIATNTFLCTYHGQPSDILPNSQAQQKIYVPEVRNELRKNFHGPGENFDAYLSEHFYDLHYQALPAARPLSLGLGHLWRLAVDHPNSPVLPCIHRAPQETDGKNRLLLIC